MISGARVQTRIRPKPRHTLATVAVWRPKKSGVQHHGHSNNDHKAERAICKGCERARTSSEVESREARRRHHSCETPCWDTHNLSVSSTSLTPRLCRRTTAVLFRKDAFQSCISATSQTSMSLSPQDMFAATHSSIVDIGCECTLLSKWSNATLKTTMV